MAGRGLRDQVRHVRSRARRVHLDPARPGRLRLPGARAQQRLQAHVDLRLRPLTTGGPEPLERLARDELLTAALTLAVLALRLARPLPAALLDLLRLLRGTGRTSDHQQLVDLLLAVVDLSVQAPDELDLRRGVALDGLHLAHVVGVAGLG